MGNKLLDWSSAFIAAVLPRRVVAHAFARVCSDVAWHEGFRDPGGMLVQKVIVGGLVGREWFEVSFNPVVRYSTSTTTRGPQP
jgi:hypothetical protein